MSSPSPVASVHPTLRFMFDVVVVSSPSQQCSAAVADVLGSSNALECTHLLAVPDVGTPMLNALLIAAEAAAAAGGLSTLPRRPLSDQRVLIIHVVPSSADAPHPCLPLALCTLPDGTYGVVQAVERCARMTRDADGPGTILLSVDEVLSCPHTGRLNLTPGTAGTVLVSATSSAAAADQAVYLGSGFASSAGAISVARWKVGQENAGILPALRPAGVVWLSGSAASALVQAVR